MTTHAKICGLSEPATLDAAVRGGASYVGFVFFSKSPRNVTGEQAAMLASRVADHVGRVGVFVDPDDAQVKETAAAARLTAIQLHGDESPARVAAIKALTGLDVWKAVPVRTAADIADARAYAGAADLLLFDAKPPKGADLPGGLGLRFDWRLLSGYRAPLRWGVSGGLDAANVREAIGVTATGLVDVSSGVEDRPGVKSMAKIEAFLKAVSKA
ncbi:N-(5'-phosphoribosyl)anthranilate isomerase [Tardibacter chloracetimidivorans]|uniref:N-(5'-phosphoribosyl)anthranilate isomerase n=1 Tax=Tardibacter chloracetimidivorans TaxID=1921510 RepID=A0A1L3ZYW2_9SPHN|nr:phosphoribosylanthranilate isomerase [Tardibacter chloracetimidivorans]API60812.1 N-(5'-phosphoribosyl)anthranilate isomerase [Tardibacter chloracetimidivorans]